MRSLTTRRGVRCSIATATATRDPEWERHRGGGEPEGRLGHGSGPRSGRRARMGRGGRARARRSLPGRGPAGRGAAAVASAARGSLAGGCPCPGSRFPLPRDSAVSGGISAQLAFRARGTLDLPGAPGGGHLSSFLQWALPARPELALQPGSPASFQTPQFDATGRGPMRAAVAWAGPQCPPPEALAREPCGRLLAAASPGTSDTFGVSAPLPRCAPLSSFPFPLIPF